ncbi:1-phosphofructokinase family hexose kinase [Roseinatronobacter sp.]|uniref:1-phosphofructokinase family hexose kinase n=1 Tax=Roseinatronobacter sp. TaxID=1945755 RepID=UPI0025D0560F|nr:hexose kinase [Rhodobaca sp.]
MISAQTPILTVTLNPALDLSARVSRMEAGPKLRLSDTDWEPGGGGVNVAKAIHALEGDVLAWVALGGGSGEQHLRLLQRQGIPTHVFDAPGDTRQSWAITDDSGQQFRLQLPGDTWAKGVSSNAFADILAQAKALVVLSGSQPPGVPADFAQALAQELGAGRLIVDTSGPALTQLIERPLAQARLFVLRLDQAEAEALAGDPLADVADTSAFAQTLVARGVAEHVCLARGADGSVLAGTAGVFHCRPPTVCVQSKVGAGDSFTGAFTLALARGGGFCEALRLGTAAAAAAVMTAGTQLCRLEDVTQLLDACELHQMGA